MFVWLSKKSRDDLVNDEMYNKLLMELGGLGVVFLIGCAIGYWGFPLFLSGVQPTTHWHQGFSGRRWN